jgi:serine/threonine protein kinase
MVRRPLPSGAATWSEMSEPEDADATRTVVRSTPAASQDGNVLPAGCRLNEYVIESTLGNGSFGIVYLARDEQLYRQVAIKEFMPGALAARRNGFSVVVKSERHRATFEAGLRSFVNEARLLARFDHPALVKVYRFWEQNDTAYMVMPYYRGQTLKQWLRAQGAPVPEATLLRIVGAVLEALERLHADNVFHRDVAPDNILMLDGGQPLLLDLGAARQIIGDMTQALTVFLKPGYAPVEQYGEDPSMRQGPWTDIYAMAAVMYFAVMGKAPAPSVARMIQDELRPLRSLAEGMYSPGLLSAIDRGLALRPEDRPASVAEFRCSLGLTQTDAPRPPPALPDDDATVIKAWLIGASASRSRKRRPLAIGAIAAVLVAGAVLVPWLMRPHSVESRATPIPTAPVADKKAPATGAASEARPQVATIQAPTARPVEAPPQVAPIQPPTARPVALPDAAKVLQQIFERRSASIAVGAKAARTRLVIGRDALQLTVTTEQSGYLTVLMANGAGELLQIFPDQKQREFRMDPNFPARLSNIVAKGPPGVDQILCIVSGKPLGLATESLAGEDFSRVSLSRMAMEPVAAASSRCASGAIDCEAAFGATLLEISEIER